MEGGEYASPALAQGGRIPQVRCSRLIRVLYTLFPRNAFLSKSLFQSRAPLPYQEYCNTLLSTFLAFRESPSHAVISSLHQIVINQNIDSLLHLISLQSKLWDPSLFSLLGHWEPTPSDQEYLKGRAGYYPIDPYISTLLDRCEIPKQKPPGSSDDDDDSDNNYLLNYDTVAKWVHAPAMLFNALPKYLSELSTDPGVTRKCSVNETREESLANLVTCLRVLHAYIYKTQVVTDVLFGVPSLIELVKNGSIVDGQGKVHKHRRRRGGSRKAFEEKECLAGAYMRLLSSLSSTLTSQ